MSSKATTTTAAGATPEPGTDHTAVAMLIFREAIVTGRQAPVIELGNWVRMLKGLGGYLASTAQTIDSRTSTLQPLQSLGDAIERAATIASLLTDEVEGQLLRAGVR